MSVSVNGTNGITFNDGTTQSTVGYVPWRNRIINGDMRIWQRGTSFTVGSATFTYTADRWVFYSTNSSSTISRSTSVPTGSGFPYSAQVQRTAGNTGTNALFFEQVIESNNMLDLAGQTVTLSFWARAGANFSSSSTGVYINTGTVADQGSATSLGAWTGYTSATTYSFSPTTTWTRYTTTATLSSAALELAVLFFFNPTGTAGADDSLYITGVQLEAGTTATPFERVDYSEMLRRCQRYGWAMPANVFINGALQTTTATFLLGSFPVTMRAAPTITASGNFTVDDYFSTTTTGTSTGGISSTVGFKLQVSGHATLSTPRPMEIAPSNTGTAFFSAEL